MPEKLGLDFVVEPRLRQAMHGDNESRHGLVCRLFYLITVAAEDAAALAVEGQSVNSGINQVTDAAVRLRGLGESIEILSLAIEELGRNTAEDRRRNDASKII